MTPEERPQSPSQYVAWVQHAVSSTDGRTQATSAPTVAGKAKGSNRSCNRWKDLGTGRCGWCQGQVWVAGAGEEHHSEAPLLTARCQAALSQKTGRGVKHRVGAKVAIPSAGRTHLSPEKKNYVQKSMFSKVIRQVCLSEVLTQVLSMLKTGPPNGKCPRGGF